MNRKSRTKNVTYNMVIGLLCQLTGLLLNFASRTVFVKTLGQDYLGVEGLFTNILTILSFAELGIGNAIVFSLYKAINDEDEAQICSLMQLYKKAYTVIGLVIVVAGVCVLPFLTVIIKNKPDIPEDLRILYLLFLANTAASYFLAYKKALITADQKNYLVLLINEAVRLVQVILQIILLKLTHQYILYLLVQLCCTVISNYINALLADNQYPFLKNTKAAKLSIEATKKIFTNIKALAVYKFGSVILNGTDNILVTRLDKVSSVGVISNYTLICSSCTAILGKIVDAFNASIGNLNVKAEPEKQMNVFFSFFLITAWVFGFAAVGMDVVSSDFITAWLGERYLLDRATSIAIFAEFFVKGVHHPAYVYRTTLGYFTEGKVAPIAAAIINIALSIALFRCVGLCGIFIATPVSRILTTGVVDPVLIFRKAFGKSPIRYYIKYVLYLLIFIVTDIICRQIIAFLPFSGWMKVFTDIVMVTIVFNAMMLICFCRTAEFKMVFAGIKNIANNRKK